MIDAETGIDYGKFAVGDTVAIAHTHIGTTTVQMGKILRETKTLWIVQVGEADHIARKFYKKDERREQAKSSSAWRQKPYLMHKDAPVVLEALEYARVTELWSKVRNTYEQLIYSRNDRERVDLAVDALVAYRDALKAKK